MIEYRSKLFPTWEKALSVTDNDFNNVMQALKYTPSDGDTIEIEIRDSTGYYAVFRQADEPDYYVKEHISMSTVLSHANNESVVFAGPNHLHRAEAYRDWMNNA